MSVVGWHHSTDNGSRIAAGPVIARTSASEWANLSLLRLECGVVKIELVT